MKFRLWNHVCLLSVNVRKRCSTLRLHNHCLEYMSKNNLFTTLYKYVPRVIDLEKHLHRSGNLKITGLMYII